jgi:hypothetical protein
MAPNSAVDLSLALPMMITSFSWGLRPEIKPLRMAGSARASLKVAWFPKGMLNLSCLKTNVVAPKAPTLIAASRCSTPPFMALAAFLTRIAMFNGPIVKELRGISIASLILDLRSNESLFPDFVRTMPALDVSINPSLMRC